MRLLCVSDIHGDLAAYGAILKREAPADLILLAGDITKRGSARQAREIVSRALDHSPALFAVTGNSDSPEVEEALVELGVSLHTRSQEHLERTHVGISGVTTGLPWRYRFKEEDFHRWLSDFDPFPSQHPVALVAHCPPRGIRDQTHFRTHAGSPALRSWLDRIRPALMVCGHIHEAQGAEQVDGTLVVNCGPAKSGCYAIVDWSFPTAPHAKTEKIA